MNPNKRHTFELSGLGNAPFKVVGYNKNDAGGGCHHCGTAITHEFLVRSDDGIQSKVGSSCVQKTGDKGLIDMAKAAKRQADAAVRNEQRMQRYEAKLNAEREANNGLTLEEVGLQSAEQDRVAFIAALGEQTMDTIQQMADDLRDGQGGFRDAMAADLEKLILPTDNKETIVLQVLTKVRHGNPRKGSNSYAQALSIEASAFNQIRSDYLKACQNLKPDQKQRVDHYGLGAF